VDDFALVRRPESSAACADMPAEPAAPAASTEARFLDIAEILSEHDVRARKLESRVSSRHDSNELHSLQLSIEDLGRRITPLETRSHGTSDRTGRSGGELGGQDTKVDIAMVCEFLHRKPLLQLMIVIGPTAHHHAAYGGPGEA
jgi:hypothetical protein